MATNLEQVAQIYEGHNLMKGYKPVQEVVVMNEGNPMDYQPEPSRFLIPEPLFESFKTLDVS